MIADLKDDLNKTIQCETCIKCKSSIQPFQRSDSKSSGLLDIVHSDIAGPMRNQSLGGNRYFLTFIDDYSRYITVFIIRYKSQTLQCFKEFVALAEKQTGRKVKILRSDNGTEYTNGAFQDYLKINGIIHQTSAPHTPQQNGIAERMNRTLVEMARSMLSDSNMEANFWGEAISTSVYIRNRCYTKSNDNKTPYECWFGARPSISHLRIFGCKAYVLNKAIGLDKFQEKSKEMMLIGYCDYSKAYKLYDPARKTTVKSRDVKFIEHNNHNNVAVIEMESNQKSSDNFEIISENSSHYESAD